MPEEAEILSHIPNSGIVHLPGRRFPGIVLQGDTVFNLAKRYGLTAEEIAKANSLGSGFHIKLGQQIRIPVKH